MSSDSLSPRAASLLRTLVDMHIREGQPVGSKALHGESGMSVSPATIRNVMSDLEDRGFLSSPHISAGRVPTAQGYRLFVDSLLQAGPIDEAAIQALKHELNRADLRRTCCIGVKFADAGHLTGGHYYRSSSDRVAASANRIPTLSDSRVLVILVVNEREVQNRVIELSRPLT